MVDTCDVLVVDDDEAVRESLCDFLTNEGLSSHAVPDGAAALRFLETIRPGLIMTDMVMPGMNGSVLLERLRQHPAWSSIPVIRMSASHPFAPGVISKPFADPERLRVAIHTALGK